MTTRTCALATVIVVMVAGCSVALDAESTLSPSETPTPGVEPETPTAMTTPNETSPFPPGVNESTLVNVTALLEAHTAALNRTGYVANGTGNTTIMRSGFLIDVSRDVRIVAVNGSQRYFEVRQTRAGPVDRRLQRYANGTVEFRRLEEDGEVTYRIRKPQTAEELARVDHLDSFLRGGNFSVVEVRNDTDPTTVLLAAMEADNMTALLSGLPEDAQRIQSYEAAVLVDAEGRVRRVNATVEYVIGGKNRTHTISYTLTRIGVANVSRPAWVEEAKERLNDSDGQAGRSGRRQGPTGDVAAAGGAATTGGIDRRAPVHGRSTRPSRSPVRVDSDGPVR